MMDEVTIDAFDGVTFHVGDVIGIPDSDRQYEVIDITEIPDPEDEYDDTGYYLHVETLDREHTSRWWAESICHHIKREHGDTQFLRRADE